MKITFSLFLVSILFLTGCAPTARTAPIPPARQDAPIANKVATRAPMMDPTLAPTTAPTDETAPEPVHTDPVDLTHLPLGDGHVSTGPVAGSVWSCQTQFNSNAGGAFREGPWIKADGTFDLTAKPSVDGAISWPSQFQIFLQGGQRVIRGNALPKHATGQYPVSSSDDAYTYDRNPNRIQAQTVQISLPANPQLAGQPSCLPMGQIGVLLSGSYFFNALDGPGRDAVAHEIQDECQGHPERSGAYHYHNLSNCIEDGGSGHSALMGYALDGFGIYGYRGEDGQEMTNAALDACHGHTHAIEWDGQRVEMYHYHATHEYPYTLGCFMGTAATTRQGGQPEADQGNAPANNNPTNNNDADACRPDLARVAATLNISVDDLRAALGNPSQGRPDLAAAATRLGISLESLQTAMQGAFPANCTPPGGGGGRN